MKYQAAYAPVRTATDLRALGEVLQPVFGISPELWTRYATLIGRKNFRLMRGAPPKGRRIAGGLAIIPMGQWFGGRCVHMTGVAVVGVEPGERSRGTAGAMMAAMLRELRRNRMPISVLYPATLPLYRRAGYELAGSRFEISIPLRHIDVGKREMDASRRLLVRPVAKSDFPTIQNLHRQRALTTSGNLERGPFHWARIREPRGEKMNGYVVVEPSSSGKVGNALTPNPSPIAAACHRRGESIVGYVYFIQRDTPGGDHHHVLSATDVMAATPEAAHRILRLFADHRSMCEGVTYFGSAADILLRCLPEKAAKVRLFEHWMLRMVDIERAVAARGYSPAISAEACVRITDDILPENDGVWTFQVRDGAGRARKVSGDHGSPRQARRASRRGRQLEAKAISADVTIDVRGLAALYTGFLSPVELVQSGHIVDVRPGRRGTHAMESLSAMFAGPAPWMTEMF